MNARMTRVVGAVTGALALGVAAPLYAGMIRLTDAEGQDSGWQASWDDSLDPYVSISVEDVIFDTNAVYIRKEAEFTQGPVNGLFPSIIIMFRQVSIEAVGNIVISEEVVTNSTGRSWTDFHMSVTGGNDVAFDPDATGASGGGGPIGFSVGPFTGASFTNGNQRLNLDDGSVAAGETWQPGSPGIGDDLWISAEVRETAPLTTFWLKERPTPEPATLAMLGLAASAVIMRRRRN